MILTVYDPANDLSFGELLPSQGDAKEAAVRELLTRCVRQWPEVDLSQCVFVCNGKMLSFEDAVRSLCAEDTVRDYRVFLFRVDPAVLQTGHTLKVDPLSLSAAQAWLVSCADEAAMMSETAQIAMALQAPKSSSTTTTGEAAEAANAVPAQAQALQAQQGGLQRVLDLLQVGVLVRLLVFCGLFCYNRSMSDHRKYMLAGVMLLVYLFESRLLMHLVQWLRNKFNRPNNAGERRAAANGEREGEAAAAAEVQREGGEEGAGVGRIPVGPGLARDLCALVVSVIASFLPGWRPQPVAQR